MTEFLIDTYFFYLATVEKTDSNYVCSPQMTIVASIIIVVVIILGLIAGFAIFYRYKKRQWLNGRKGSDYRTPSSFLSTVSGNVSGNRRIHPNPISRYCFIMIDKKRCYFQTCLNIPEVKRVSFLLFQFIKFSSTSITSEACHGKWCSWQNGRLYPFYIKSRW